MGGDTESQKHTPRLGHAVTATKARRQKSTTTTSLVLLLFTLLVTIGFLRNTVYLHNSALTAIAPLHDDFVSDQPNLAEADASASVETAPNTYPVVANSTKNTSNEAPVVAKALSTRINWNAGPPAAAAAKVSTRINWNAVAPRKQPEEEEDYIDDIERALVLVCMGEQATHSRVVERFVYSARTAGNFSSWIVVLTDAPQGRYEKLSKWTENLIVVRPREEDVKTHFEVANMAYKRFKTMVLDYVDRESKLDKVEIVYYLDADIVIGNDLGKAFRGIEKRYAIGRLGAIKRKKTIARGRMWMFEGNMKKWPIQGGQIILDRKVSRPCLERWRKGFDAADAQTEQKDQYMLREMREEMKETREGRNKTVLDCEIMKMAQSPYIEFPRPGDIRSQNEYLKRNPEHRHKKSYSPIMHLRNDGGVASLGKSNMRMYMMDLLNFREGDPDPLGVLKQVRMDTTKKKHHRQQQQQQQQQD